MCFVGMRRVTDSNKNDENQRRTMSTESGTTQEEEAQSNIVHAMQVNTQKSSPPTATTNTVPTIPSAAVPVAQSGSGHLEARPHPCSSHDTAAPSVRKQMLLSLWLHTQHGWCPVPSLPTLPYAHTSFPLAAAVFPVKISDTSCWFIVDMSWPLKCPDFLPTGTCAPVVDSGITQVQCKHRCAVNQPT